MKTKTLVITILLMILAYAILTALYTFVWMIRLGISAAFVTIIVIAYFKIRNFFKGK